MLFGAMVTAAREARKWTKVELGRHLGCDHARIVRIEGGAAPTAKQAAALIRLLDLDEAKALAALEGLVVADAEEAPAVAEAQ